MAEILAVAVVVADVVDDVLANAMGIHGGRPHECMLGYRRQVSTAFFFSPHRDDHVSDDRRAMMCA